MKTPISTTARSKRHDKGFALVVTLTLMILLTVIAVGLLGLSAVSLRTSSQQVAVSEARANARLALMLALGDLQKYAGPDQRITATADIKNGTNAAKKKYTGIWKSNEIEQGQLPKAGDYTTASRDGKFLAWLASSNGTDGYTPTFNESAATDPIDLWSTNTVGTADKISASRIKMNDAKDKPVGRFAYAVTDEGVKARINTSLVENKASNAAKSAQLGTGQRASSSAIAGLEGLERKAFLDDSPEFKTIRKGVTWKNHALAANSLEPGIADSLELHYHDVTTLSSSVLANVASGGLKRDLHMIANGSTLPSEFAGKGVYESILGVSGPSDPRWESLHDISKLYRSMGSRGGAPQLSATRPAGWVAASGSDPAEGKTGVVQKAPPAGAILMPSIAKVQIICSLVVRDIYKYSPAGKKTTNDIAQERTDPVRGSEAMHGPWDNSFAGTDHDYLLNMIYTPLVTVHNPYNVALEFQDLRVVFGHVPFGIQVFRNGESQTNGLAPLDTMYGEASDRGLVSKRFGMNLKSSATSGVFRLLPGEVVLFSPNIDPSTTYLSQFTSGRTFLDLESGSTRTLAIDGLPGWRGNGIGFSLDWFCPSYNGLRKFNNEPRTGGYRGGVIPVKWDDEFSVKFAPVSVPGLSNNKFTVEVFAKQTGNTQASVGVIELDYKQPTALQDALLGPGGVITYPTTDKQGVTVIKASEMHLHSSVQIRNVGTAVKPFAMVTAYAKTTNGGSDELDGRYHAKPWAFSHAPNGVSTNDLKDGHASWGSHEFDIVSLTSTDNLFQFDPSGRSFFITGFTSNSGTKFGAMYDIPIGPLQSLQSLNSANPGGSSGYQPRFAQPIGNSWAHPMMKTEDITANGVGGTLMDHSYLLNRALYDHFYFSGFGDRTGSFGDKVKANSIAKSFIEGERLSDPRLVMYHPDGKPSSTLESELSSSEFYKQVAAWQMLEGGFNINSTSVSAWKAMLASVHDPDAIYSLMNLTAKSSTLAALGAPSHSTNEARISRFRLPASKSKAKGGDTDDAYWLGPREYSEADIQKLAEEIVEQVKARGPFLSLSDFVNRPIGATSGDTDVKYQMGALQNAIDESDINDQLASDAGAKNISTTEVAAYKYENPAAAAGSSHQAAPGYLSQADIMSVLGNAATARSDTFTIRGYGESRNKSDQIVARATCEAVVQRVPDYVDSTDLAHEPYKDPSGVIQLTAANQRFGRKFVIVSFRWLNSTEI